MSLHPDSSFMAHLSIHYGVLRLEVEQLLPCAHFALMFGEPTIPMIASVEKEELHAVVAPKQGTQTESPGMTWCGLRSRFQFSLLGPWIKSVELAASLRIGVHYS